MPNYIRDNTALPGAKADNTAGATGELTAAEYNTIRQALLDIQTVMRLGGWSPTLTSSVTFRGVTYNYIAANGDVSWGQIAAFFTAIGTWGVTLDGAQTLSNKILTAPTINNSPSVAPFVLQFGFASTPNDTTARFAIPGGPGDAVTANEPCVTFPFAGKISLMRVNLFNAGRNNTTFTLRKEYVDTALTCALAGGNQASNLVNTVSFVAGERIGLKVQQSATAGTPPDYVTISFLVTQA